MKTYYNKETAKNAMNPIDNYSFLFFSSWNNLPKEIRDENLLLVGSPTVAIDLGRGNSTTIRKMPNFNIQWAMANGEHRILQCFTPETVLNQVTSLEIKMAALNGYSNPNPRASAFPAPER